MYQRTVNYFSLQDFDFCDDSLSEISDSSEITFGSARYSLYNASRILDVITDKDDRAMLENFIRVYGNALIDVEES